MDKHEISSYSEGLNERVSHYLTKTTIIINMMIQNKMLERIQLTLSHEDLGEEPKWITVVSNKILEVKSSIESAELETKYLLEELLKIYEVLNAENYTTFRTDLQKTVMSLKKEAWDTFKMKKTNNFKSLVLRKSQRNNEAVMAQFMEIMNKDEILETDFKEAMEVLEQLS